MKKILAIIGALAFARCSHVQSPTPGLDPWLFVGETPAINGGAVLEMSPSGRYEHIYFIADDILDDEHCLTAMTVRETGSWSAENGWIVFRLESQEGNPSTDAILQGRFKVGIDRGLHRDAGQLEHFRRVDAVEFQREKEELVKDGFGVYRAQML